MYFVETRFDFSESLQPDLERETNDECAHNRTEFRAPVCVCAYACVCLCVHVCTPRNRSKVTKKGTVRAQCSSAHHHQRRRRRQGFSFLNASIAFFVGPQTHKQCTLHTNARVCVCVWCVHASHLRLRTRAHVTHSSTHIHTDSHTCAAAVRMFVDLGKSLLMRS